MNDSNFCLGSSGARFVAFLIDTFASYAVQIAGGVIGMMIAGLMSRKLDPTLTSAALQSTQTTGLMVGMFFWGIVFTFTNTVIMQGLYGYTLGKKIMGLQVVTELGGSLGIPKALGRHFATILSALPLYLGFAAILWTKRRQAFHDSICGTLVIERPAASVQALSPSTASQGLDASRPSFPNAA